jgi:hypothetical protein
MSEMLVERVARAAFERWDFAGGRFEQLPADAQEHWRNVARAAIEAMREPVREPVREPG